MFNEVYLLNLPNPPGINVYKAFAGGFGTLGANTRNNFLIPQYLVYSASACENSDVKYRVLDAQALNYDFNEVLKDVQKSSPRMIISWLSLPSLKYDLEFLNRLKKELENTLIVGYGTVCKVLQEEILQNNIDAILVGNYPYYTTISNLIKSFDGRVESLKEVPGIYLKINDKIVSKPPIKQDENLNELNLLVYHKLPIEKYISEYFDRDNNIIHCIPILTGVGCHFGCIYCPYPLGYGRRITIKSLQKILEEIKFLSVRYKIQGFVLREQAFTYDKKRILEFCEEIKLRGLEIKWAFETRADLVDKELLEIMKDAGCFRIHYGVETGDEETLKKIGKPLLSNKTIKKAFRDTKNSGIFAHAHMMIGFPGEGRDTVNNSIRLLKEINPDDIDINIVTPYPGTKLYNIMSDEEVLITKNWEKYTSYEPVIRTKNLNRKELKIQRNHMKTEFYKFKLKTDPNFRHLFLKKLPKKLWNKLKFVSLKTS